MDTSYPLASFAADSVFNNNNKTNGAVDNHASPTGDSFGIDMPTNDAGDVVGSPAELRIPAGDSSPEIVPETEIPLGGRFFPSIRKKSTLAEPSSLPASLAPPAELGAGDDHGSIQFICKPKVRLSGA